jgi:hypothetical protein
MGVTSAMRVNRSVSLLRKQQSERRHRWTSGDRLRLSEYERQWAQGSVHLSDPQLAQQVTRAFAAFVAGNEHTGELYTDDSGQDATRRTSMAENQNQERNPGQQGQGGQQQGGQKQSGQKQGQGSGQQNPRGSEQEGNQGQQGTQDRQQGGQNRQSQGGQGDKGRSDQNR